MENIERNIHELMQGIAHDPDQKPDFQTEADGIIDNLRSDRIDLYIQIASRLNTELEKGQVKEEDYKKLFDELLEIANKEFHEKPNKIAELKTSVIEIKSRRIIDEINNRTQSRLITKIQDLNDKIKQGSIPKSVYNRAFNAIISSARASLLEHLIPELESQRIV